jgi:hypothetical protein
MTLTLDMPPDLEERLTAEAARCGLSVAEYLLDLARASTPDATSDQDADADGMQELLTGPWPQDEPRPSNGAELVPYWQRHGLIGTRPDITDCLEHARRLRRKAERRARS